MQVIFYIYSIVIIDGRWEYLVSEGVLSECEQGAPADRSFPGQEALFSPESQRRASSRVRKIANVRVFFGCMLR